MGDVRLKRTEKGGWVRKKTEKTGKKIKNKKRNMSSSLERLVEIRDSRVATLMLV